MLDYAEFLAIKKSNPDDLCYIENIVYEIEECHQIISMWNGYELEKVFNIKEPNIKDVFSEEQWNNIIRDVINSKFWLDNWRYSDAINKAFSKQGLKLKSVNGRPSIREKKQLGNRLKDYKMNFAKTQFGYHFKRHIYKIFQRKIIERKANPEKLFYTTDENIYGGHLLQFCYKGNNIELIENDIRHAFRFKELTDEKNINILKIISDTNSVSIHARRGDMLSVNKYCYEFGYFKRAVRFIKDNVNSPVFFFFCDPNSVQWCKENYKIFGIDEAKDTVYFVDWNKGEDSYKDMQLMSKCKHNIITTSSFGWWGAFLNENKDKITCSPDVRINTTHFF